VRSFSVIAPQLGIRQRQGCERPAPVLWVPPSSYRYFCFICWQLLSGLTLQKDEGFNHSGTYTDPGTNTDLNNPNFRLNRAGSAIFTDIPWSFNLSGSYQLPYDVGRPPTDLLASGDLAGGARVSPDKRWVAYTSNRGGSDEI